MGKIEDVVAAFKAVMEAKQHLDRCWEDEPYEPDWYCRSQIQDVTEAEARLEAAINTLIDERIQEALKQQMPTTAAGWEPYIRPLMQGIALAKNKRMVEG